MPKFGDLMLDNDGRVVGVYLGRTPPGHRYEDPARGVMHYPYLVLKLNGWATDLGYSSTFRWEDIEDFPDGWEFADPKEWKLVAHTCDFNSGPGSDQCGECGAGA